MSGTSIAISQILHVTVEALIFMSWFKNEVSHRERRMLPDCFVWMARHTTAIRKEYACGDRDWFTRPVNWFQLKVEVKITIGGRGKSTRT